MPAKSPRQIKHVDLVKRDSILIEDHLQPRHVRTLGLREFVHVAFEKKDSARRIEFKTRLAIFESAELVHPSSPQKFAHQIDKAGTANSFRRLIANHTKLERAIFIH